MSQEKYDYLIDYVNYVENITIMQHMIFNTFCKYNKNIIYYCDVNCRIRFWQDIKDNIFVPLLTSDEITYLSGKNPQKIDYFFNSAPEQIIRQTCQPFARTEDIINNLMNYERDNYEKLKKAYIEFIRSMIYKKFSASSTSEIMNIKQALSQLLTFVKMKQDAFNVVGFTTHVGTIFVLDKDLKPGVPKPDSWGYTIRGVFIRFMCNINGKQDFMYAFPAPMFTDDFVNLLHEFLNKTDTTTPPLKENNETPLQDVSYYSSTGVNETIPSVPQPLLPVVCSSEDIRNTFTGVRDPLEAATAYAFKLLGFDVRTNVYEKNRAGQDVEIDVKAIKGGLEIYASCKNLDRPVDRPTVEQEVGRVNSLKKLPHLKVLVVSSLNDQARETAKSEGFLLVELNKKVTYEDLDTACIEIRKQLGRYFETLAPPELVSAYTALQEALNSLKNVEEELKKVITVLQKASNKE
jgi:hypothetical protein